MEQYYEQQLAYLCRGIRRGDEAAAAECRRRWDGIAKPLGGLGLLEEAVIKIAGSQESADIRLERKGVVVFCADNGVVAEGVTQTGSQVTAAVAEHIARGTATVSLMAAAAGADVMPVDIGVAGELSFPGIYGCKIAHGTGNIRREPAMTREQALEAVHEGIRLAGRMKDSGYDLLAVGEMGIGNTTTSSAVLSVLLDLPTEAVTGRGAGLPAEGLARKRQVVREAVALHHPDPADPIGVLAALGGLDIAGMCGLMLGGAIYRIPVVLDGLISLAAALLARGLSEAVTDHLLASHVGREPACAPALERLGLKPLICGQLSMGEGCGAVMLFPLLDMAEAVYRGNRTFDDLGIRAYERYEDR